MGVAQEGALPRIKKAVIESALVQMIATYFQVEAKVVAFGGGALIALFVLYGFGGQLLCSLAGLAYPAFQSFKALEKRRQDQELDDVQFWLSYWTVYSGIALVESMTYYLLIWFPFYYPIKLGLLLWLSSPATRGADHAYRLLVAPLLDRNRHHIEDALDASARELKRTAKCLQATSAAAGSEGRKKIRKVASHIASITPRPSLSGLGGRKSVALLEREEVKLFDNKTD